MTESVATEEDRKLRDYELVIIISPKATEEELEARVNNISQYITDNGGAVSEIERWGKRRLAYPINHYIEGSYVLTRFRLRPVFGKELTANLRISDEVLRHLLIRLDS